MTNTTFLLVGFDVIAFGWLIWLTWENYINMSISAGLGSLMNSGFAHLRNSITALNSTAHRHDKDK